MYKAQESLAECYHQVLKAAWVNVGLTFVCKVVAAGGRTFQKYRLKIKNGENNIKLSWSLSWILHHIVNSSCFKINILYSILLHNLNKHLLIRLKFFICHFLPQQISFCPSSANKKPLNNSMTHVFPQSAFLSFYGQLRLCKQWNVSSSPSQEAWPDSRTVVVWQRWLTVTKFIRY